MPPYNDIYIVTTDRSEACINKFLTKYADLTTDKANADYFGVWNSDDYVETETLPATISYALADSRRSAVVYLDSTVSELKSVILYFTSDGKLVLGLSNEYDEDSDEQAERILAMLKADFNIKLSVITCETPPSTAYSWINKNTGQL